MTVQHALQQGQVLLKEADVGTPFLDSLILLAEAAKTDKEHLLASYPDQLTPEIEQTFFRYLEERLQGIPVSYIRGKKEFYGQEFLVDRRVLVPRPETELLVDLVLNHLSTKKERDPGRNGSPLRIHDACTGSGAIAISLALGLREDNVPAEISASDISSEAGEIFEENCIRLLGNTLSFVQSDLLTGVAGQYDAITANPPYLTDGTVIRMKEAGWPEPASALKGGIDGLDPYRKLAPQIANHLNGGGTCFLEADPQQMPAIGKLLENSGFSDITFHPDLTGRERAISGTLAQ